jgi:dynein heavy chain 1
LYLILFFYNKIIGTCNVLSTPLQRCLARENAKGFIVLKLVLSNLNSVKLYCNHEIKVTNDLRDLMACFIKGIIPNKWRTEYIVTNDVPVGTWIRDFASRLQVLESYQVIINSSVVSSNIIYNIGKMFSPESFITATRQYAAQVYIIVFNKY